MVRGGENVIRRVAATDRPSFYLHILPKGKGEEREIYTRETWVSSSLSTPIYTRFLRPR